jgi:two-component system response regulator AtoC
MPQQDAKPQVMVVDDDLFTRDYLQTFLSARGCHAVAVDNVAAALKLYNAERPVAVILEVFIPKEVDGLGAISAFKKIDREVPVIAVSGHGRTMTVVQAMKLGASDFVSKPFNEAELDVPLANALKHRQQSRQMASLREQLQTEPQFNMLFGENDCMAQVRDLIERVADTDVSVLVQGESGTGKELVARALYATSRRHDKPFVKVNCAALPTELLESELFGFERGAFTGADRHKPGRFEFANHGTMFLDEVAEMSPTLQAKLLQVLQDGEFSRLGGKHDVQVDVRIIAATNRNLERAVATRQFREDLFFRLNVVSVHLPPLRERREEIPILTDYFLTKYSVQYHKPRVEISDDTMELFMDYPWPGNVRELENLIKRTVVLGTEAAIHREISHDHLKTAPAFPSSNIHAVTAPSVSLEPANENGHCSLKDVSRAAARAAESKLILKILIQKHWNRKKTAEILGISYKALLYKIKENGLDKAS